MQIKSGWHPQPPWMCYCCRPRERLTTLTNDIYLFYSTVTETFTGSIFSGSSSPVLVNGHSLSVKVCVKVCVCIRVREWQLCFVPVQIHWLSWVSLSMVQRIHLYRTVFSIIQTARVPSCGQSLLTHPAPSLYCLQPRRPSCDTLNQSHRSPKQRSDLWSSLGFQEAAVSTHIFTLVRCSHMMSEGV